MSRYKYTAVERLTIITEFSSSSLSLEKFSEQYGLSGQTIRRWLLQAKHSGMDGLENGSDNRHYSQTFKLKLVQAYLNGEGSYDQLSYENGLRSSTQLRDWVIRYNKDQTMTASPSRKQAFTTMNRKTTFEERAKIVAWITEQNHSYSEAAEHFNVSYQQARLWTLKAQAKGSEGLVDRRGHRKPEKELTDLDKANRKIRQLEAKIKDQELIEKFVKKYLELQRRG